MLCVLCDTAEKQQIERINPLMKKVALMVVAVLALDVSAHGVNFDHDDDAVALRQAHMHLIGTYFGEMGAMMKGKVSYDPVAFSEGSDRLAALSGWSHEGFSTKRLTDDSKSKPVIWEKKTDFDQKMKAFHKQALKLQEVIAKGDMGNIKGEFKATANACGSCHDVYKSK